MGDLNKGLSLLKDMQRKQIAKSRLAAVPKTVKQPGWLTAETSLADISFVALDVETRSYNASLPYPSLKPPVDPHLDLPVQIGAVRFGIDGREEQTLETFVDPQKPIVQSESVPHDISDDDVAGQPIASEILPRLSTYLDKPNTLVLTYTSYDSQVLGFCYFRSEIEFPPSPVLDVHRLAKDRLSSEAIEFPPKPSSGLCGNESQNCGNKRSIALLSCARWPWRWELSQLTNTVSTIRREQMR